MKKSELKRIIQEELKGYSKYYPGGETKGGTSDEFGTILRNIALGTPDKDPKDKEPIKEEGGNLTALDIQEFVQNALNLRDYDVDVKLNPAYNEIKLTIKRDPSEEDFNAITKYLEDNGYTVDYNQSRREGEDDGDRYYYPRIRFN